MLRKILERKQAQVSRDKIAVPLNRLIMEMPTGNFVFAAKLRQKRWNLIAECKLASPLKGRLCDLTIGDLAKVYGENGAAALSVLTDSHFSGAAGHVGEAKAAAALPVLRKDFVIDPYQIYQARAIGADAVLLIAAILSDEQLSEYQEIAKAIGLDCLVEVHTLEELMRVQRTNAEFIGINNRNLKTFQTNLDTTFHLLPHCETGRTFISESGVQSGVEAIRLKHAGLRGILVGEGLVRAADVAGKTQELSLLKGDGGNAAGS